MSRISWQDYFLTVLDATAARASCDRGLSGAVIVRDNRILATGYVGAPSGLPSCDEVGHQRIMRYEYDLPECCSPIKGASIDIPLDKLSIHCIRTIHAEQNAIVNAARVGVSTLQATLYCTMVPCKVCAMMIIQAGICSVIAKHKYQGDTVSRNLLEAAGVLLLVLDETELY